MSKHSIQGGESKHSIQALTTDHWHRVRVGIRVRWVGFRRTHGQTPRKKSRYGETTPLRGPLSCWETYQRYCMSKYFDCTRTVHTYSQQLSVYVVICAQEQRNSIYCRYVFTDLSLPACCQHIWCFVHMFCRRHIMTRRATSYWINAAIPRTYDTNCNVACWTTRTYVLVGVYCRALHGSGRFWNITGRVESSHLGSFQILADRVRSPLPHSTRLDPPCPWHVMDDIRCHYILVHPVQFFQFVAFSVITNEQKTRFLILQPYSWPQEITTSFHTKLK